MRIDKMQAVLKALDQSNTVSFRKLGIASDEIASIMELVKQSNAKKTIQSISFSYNPLLGDIGAITIANNLPELISEIGLVGCEIGDAGARVLINKIEDLPNLRMLCIEQNKLSESVKDQFKRFSDNNSPVIVVVQRNFICQMSN
ncbi:MAG: Leucine-rich repeat (LRR) protein [Marivirga sp.]|jgi:Leucine-rich repeat (LRR) protein